MTKVGPRILVVDDEAAICRFFGEFLTEDRNSAVDTALTGAAARELLKRNSYDLAFVDLKLPDETGIEILREIRSVSPDCPVIIMTGHATVGSAVSAIRLGAFDYVEKPFDELEELERMVEAALHRDRKSKEEGAESGPESFNLVSSRDGPLQGVLNVADKIAKKNLTVLITGPTGAGKEVLARYLHAKSPRSGKPFIAVNCGAFSETLLESELFGHEKGAFTGAATIRKGIFEIADGGTLFLDEIGESTPAIQVKLLRTLETGEFMRVGGERHIKSDVRIIAATNADLKEAVAGGTFRRDLFYRLDVVSLEIPPLKDRPGDMGALIKHFLDKFLPESERNSVRLTDAAREALFNYDWPGNVREMSNVIARAVALRDDDIIDVDLFPAKMALMAGKTAARALDGAKAGEVTSEEALKSLAGELAVLLGKGASFDELSETVKLWGDGLLEEAVREAVKLSGGKQTGAARMLGAKPRAIRYFLKERRKPAL